MQIFFALLAGIVLKAEPSQSTTDNFGLILTFMCAVPPLCVAFLATPLSKYVLDADARAKALGMLASACRALRACGAGSAGRRSARVAAKQDRGERQVATALTSVSASADDATDVDAIASDV